MKSTLKILALLLSVAFLLLQGATVLAQRPAPKAEASAAVSGIERVTDDESYRIGPGDLLDVRVFGRAELTREVRVTNQGLIRLPFLDEVKVACQTEADLARLISEMYRKYLRDPQVDVFVKEYKSQPVAVIGSVMQPGRFQLQRKVRLLELLTYAGGPGGNAGGVVHVIRGSSPDFCDTEERPVTGVKAIAPVAAPVVESKGAPIEAAVSGASTPIDQSMAASQATVPVSIDHGDAQLIAYRLRDVLVGTPDSNPYIKPGDIVSVPETDQIFVTGAVIKPGAIPLRSRLTLVQALGIAGGPQPDAARSRVRLVRQDPGTKIHSEFIYNVDDIQRKKAEDVVLLPNDVIHIPSSLPKSMGRGVLGVSINMLSTLPFLIMR